MSERINRRSDIIVAARDLFVQNGYAATSIHQIAEAVGVTKAALYYHFKDKEALLQAVLEILIPNITGILPEDLQAGSLRELIVKIMQELAKDAAERVQCIRWVLNEFPHMSPSEREALHSHQLGFQQGLTELFVPFVENRQRAEKLAWVFLCSGIGYGQLFLTLDLHSVVEYSQQDFIEIVAELIACGQ